MPTLGQPVTRTDCPLGVRSVTRAGAQIDEVEGPERRLGVQLGLDDSRESDGGDRILAVVSTWAFCRAVPIFALKVVDVGLEVWAVFVITVVAGSFATFFSSGDSS